jgi:hypothetical protein
MYSQQMAAGIISSFVEIPKSLHLPLSVNNPKLKVPKIGTSDIIPQISLVISQRSSM